MYLEQASLSGNLLKVWIVTYDSPMWIRAVQLLCGRGLHALQVTVAGFTLAAMHTLEYACSSHPCCTILHFLSGAPCVPPTLMPWALATTPWAHTLQPVLYCCTVCPPNDCFLCCITTCNMPRLPPLPQHVQGTLKLPCCTVPFRQLRLWAPHYTERCTAQLPLSL